MRKLIGFCACVFAASAALAAPDADRCTFDFKAASKAIFESGAREKNYVTNPNFREKEDPTAATSWRRTNTGGYTKGMSKEKAAEVQKKIAEMVVTTLDDGMASIRVPTAAVDLFGGRDFAWGLHTYVSKLAMLDDDRGGPYRVSLRYRSNHDYGNENNYAYVFTQPVHVDDASGKGRKLIGKWMCQDFRDTGEDSDYVNFWSQDVTIPEGANAVEFNIRFMGAGYLKFTDFQLTKRSTVEKARPDVKFLMMPYGMADNTFAIEAGEVGSVTIAWNRSKTAKLDWWKSWAEVVVPKDFEYVGANMADLKGIRKITRTKRADGSEVIRLPQGNRIEPYVEERFHPSNGISLLLRAKGPVGTKGTLVCRAIGSDGRALKDEGSCTLDTIAPVKAVQPKRYRIGAMLDYAMQLYRSGGGANEAYADYLRSKGVTWIMPNTDWLIEDPTLLPMWRAKGFETITPTDHKYLKNGYGVNGTCPRPKEDAFVPKPGLNPSLGKAACPASIYEERPFFVTNIVPNLAARSAGTDGEWINWEPYFYKGCYCDYCKKRGAEWMEKTGDGNIEHFHSWQHGQIVKTVHKWMKKTMKGVGLMPAIGWEEMTAQCRKDGYPQDKLSADYADEIDWMPLWGPYVGWSPWEGAPYGGPYGIQRGRSLLVFFAAKDIREETDRFFKPGHRPKLMGQPAGTNWLIQPEWLEISCDSYLFNRWEAIAPWVFPHGGDARHWTAYARSANRAAKYEDAVWDGTRNDAATTLKAKSGFDIRCKVLDNHAFPGMVDVPLLQQTTYDYKGARYVACFNFDDESHSEFTLWTTGLADGAYEVVAEDGRVVCSATAEALATKGVELKLPVSACRVFTLKPVSSGSSVLPGLDTTKPALDPSPFPDRMSAFVWRNWGLVPVAKLAEVVGATSAELNAVAADMGLRADPVVLPEWKTKGYITVLRRNWHLLPYEQLLTLLGKTKDELHFCLMEDDFLWVKLGQIKPKCGRLEWKGGEDEKWKGARRRIAEILREEGLDPNAPEEPRFAFIKDIASPSAGADITDSNPQTLKPSGTSSSPFDFRLIFSYFADYGDPLGDPEIGSFPEGLLQKLAAQGVNAVWLHTVLRTLAKDPKYPEFGEGSEARIANLKKLVARAGKYGIKVYLYMNEPRSQPAAFFEKPGRAGMKGAFEGEQYAMCTANPETLRWLSDALAQVFARVDGLGGIFTITMSENLTHCDARWRKDRCPRCRSRKTADLVVETNRAMIEGMVRGNPKAEAVLYTWAWPKDDEEYIVRHLPHRNVRLMTVSENAMPIFRGGVHAVENDYAISVVGPGENALRMWGFARESGVPAVAKVQAANSWELSSFPYLPTMDLVAQHAVNLAGAGVNGVMLSWSLGCCPSPNLAVYAELQKGETTPDGVLDRMAARLYGDANVRRVRQAWKAFSDGFANYPFALETVYNGPQQWGVANPLYPVSTGWSATMVGIPYDDLKGWRGPYPAETYAELMGRVADGFDAGCRLLDGVAPARELNLFRAEQMHFASCRDQSRFILARAADDRQGMVWYAKAELERAKAYWPLVRADSRIGYESSNHYFFVPRDVLEKVLSCRRIVDAGH